MKITGLSPSAYNVFDECEQKFFIQQVLKYREPAGKAAEIGTIVHAVFETLGDVKKAHQENLSEIETEFFGNLKFKNIWDLDIQDILEKTIKHFESQSDHSYDSKDRENMMTMIKTVTETQEDPRNNTVIETENRFNLEIKEPWAKLDDGSYFVVRGIIDLVVKIDDQTIKFIDWKTGRRMCWITGEEKTYGKLMEDPQLLIYNLCLRKLYPEYENYICSINYLKDGGPYDLVFTKDDSDRMFKTLKQRFMRIKGVSIPVLKKTWKCKRFCMFGKKNFKNAPREFRSGQLDKTGEKMCMCSQIHLGILKDGINQVSEEYKGKEIDGD